MGHARRAGYLYAGGMTHLHPLLRQRMAARDSTEAHRVSSPLELLFDLTFVAAIATITVQLAHGIAEGHTSEVIGPFLMVFFAIWWAWMNFTWFASAYDTDDVQYRITTMVQMAGVLVLAAGVPSAFNDGNFAAVTIGYAIMRIGLVTQWIRAAIGDPAGRATALRYAGGIVLVQAGWLLRLLLPAEVAISSFVALALLELAVPLFASRTGESSWHPHHIAERYGLFTIIVLGESVLAATTGVQASLDSRGVSAELITIALAGLTLVFALWWLYFLEPAGDGLEAYPSRSYVWGYLHYGVFAALAALGAGLEVAVESAGHHLEISALAAANAVAVPVGVFLVLLWAAHLPLVITRLVIRPVVILPAAALVLLVPLAAGGLGIPGCIVAIALVCVLVIAVTLWDTSRHRAAAVTVASGAAGNVEG
ncbi:MAG: low temperature requirement protein [Glaciihabitans sp.]|nr:low temperature requirement protein [Glaciihabitans sp.]